MLNTNELNIFNTSKTTSNLEKEILKSNPTIYTNTFAQGADTSRSLSNFWTGINLASNGVYHTGDFPYIHITKENFLKLLYNNGFKINIYTSEYKLFSLPPDYKDFSNSSSENFELFLDDALKAIDTNDKTLTYIDIHDYHWAIDDYGASQKGITAGLNEAYLTLNKVNNLIGQKTDLKIIFSDHGHLFNNQIKSKKEITKHIFDNSKIRNLLSVSFSNSNETKINTRLTTLMDIFPSIIDYLNLDYDTSKLNGLSIFSNKNHSFIFSENSFSLDRKKINSIDGWKVISLDGSIYLDRYGKMFTYGSIDRNRALEFLFRNSKSYRYYSLETLQKRMFDNLDSLNVKSKYTNGNIRIKSIKTFYDIIRFLLPYDYRFTSYIRIKLKKIREYLIN
jgi:hypothetical protein